MRSGLAIVASGLAGLAAIIASLDRTNDIVPFFVGLTFLGGVVGWATHDPYVGIRRRIARTVALVWLLAAVWVGVLLIMYVTVWSGSSGPPPGPVATYLGLPATVYHLIGLYGGVVLILVSAYADRIPGSAPRPAEPIEARQG